MGVAAACQVPPARHAEALPGVQPRRRDAVFHQQAHAGQSCGPGALRQRLQQLPAHSAFALPGTRLCTIPHTEFDELATAYPSILRGLLESALQRLLATELLLSAQVADTVLTRLASYLLALPRTYDDDGNRLVTLPSSQVDVASYLGTTPETLSRRIRRLTEAGMIARTDELGGFSLDAVGLAALLRNPDDLDGYAPPA